MPSTPVGVENALTVASRVSTACNTALTQSSRRWASMAHMRGLGAVGAFQDCPPSHEPALPLRRLLRKSL